MKVCIVGNGPSSNDTAELVDSCEIVVRCGVYWRDGSQTAGKRIDVWCARRDTVNRDGPPYDRRSWCSVWCSDHEANAPWFTDLKEVLHPAMATNGFVAVAKAREQWPHATIVLVGFDAEAPAPGDPKSQDARGHSISFRGHDMAMEKQILREWGLM